MTWFTNLLHNTYFIWCAMAVILFGITQLIKLPIKHFTGKIKNERIRKIVNTTILLIPFAFGILFDFLYSTYYLKETFNAINGIGYGMAAISLYGIIERFFKVKVDNPYTTKEGVSVTELLYNLAKDGKINAKDAEAVQEFFEELIENQDEDSENEDEPEEAEKSEKSAKAEKVEKASNINTETKESEITKFLNKVK